MKRIVITGPESTGKSSLAEQLSRHYQVPWVPEFAREYLLCHGMDYSYDDLLTIARGQVALEDEMAARTQARFLIVDTDLYVMKVWCEVVFNRCHSWILDQIVSRKYDLYLLCNTDLTWVKDELREYPDLETRRKLYHIYRDIMINQPVPWIDIRGDYPERLQRAIHGIEGCFGASL